MAKLESGLLDKLGKHVSKLWPSDVSVSRIKSDTFTIHHSVCDVQYAVPGMITQNRNTVPDEFKRLVRTQNLGWISPSADFSALAAVKRTPSTTPPTATTLTAESRTSLKALRQLIQQSDQHYVRCLKSNAHAMAWTVDRSILSKQISTSGVLAALKAAKHLYPYQFTLTHFVAR